MSKQAQTVPVDDEIRAAYPKTMQTIDNLQARLQKEKQDCIESKLESVSNRADFQVITSAVSGLL